MITDFKNLNGKEIEHFKDGSGSCTIYKIDELTDKLNNLAKITIHPSSSIGHHIHTTDSEIIYCIEGNGKLFDKDGYKEFSKGMLNVIDKGEHELINTGTSDLIVLIIIIKDK